MEKKRPLLSISMLVSNNRRDTIEKCMESLVPLMNAVPSELIIVDTGCTDGSVDIARKYANKVVQFTWCKDFSAARNAGLCECTGEWFLYLDDDEWFEDVSELIAFFKGEERHHCDAVWYIQRNYDNFEGTVYTDSYVGRIVKLAPETRFRGKIHEWLEPYPRMIKMVKSYVHHYGYVFRSEEDSQKHLERNLTLEEAAVKENPDDIRMCCQLVQEYRAAKRFEDAEKFAKETLLRTKYEKTNSFVQYLMVTIPRIYIEAEELEKALDTYARLEKEEVLLHQSKLAIYCERSYIYGRLEKAKEAQEESWKYLKEYDVVPGQREPEEFPIMDFERYRSNFNRQRIIKNGITGAILCKEYDRVSYFFSALDWSYDEELSMEQLVVLVQYCMANGDTELLLRELIRVLKEEALQTLVYAALYSTYETHVKKRSMLVEALEQLNRRDGNFSYFHLLYTEQNGITTERDIADYYEKSDRKYDKEVAALFLIKEKQRMQLFSEQKRIGAIELSVKKYVAWAKKFTEAVYGAEIWEKNELPDDLPELQFAQVMEQALEERDMAEYGRRLKEALKLCPVFLSIVKALLEERETLTLAAQLKATVRLQLAEGKMEDAKEILSELVVLVPWDEEVKRMLLEL